MIIVLMLVTSLSLSAMHAQKAEVTSLTAEQGTWVAHIKGGLHLARQLAANHDFTLVDQVEGFEDHYSLVPRRFSKRNGPDKSTRQKIEEHPLVLWAEEQIAKERTKRYPARGEREFSYRKIGNTAPDKSDGSDDIWVSEMEERHASHQIYGDRQSRGIFSYFLSRYWHVFNDSLWKNQWYLQDYRTSGDVPVLDLNVVPCYEEGVTGKGVKIAILDDGLEWDHPDLSENYDPSISIDLIEGDRDPKPRYAANADNSHGTRCAGEIAMVANNSFCGVGVAFNARVGGIKLLDGPTTDLVEGKALIYALDQVDIYSSSWGPPDNGRVVEAPGRVASKAFEIGSSKGREGRGAIYVFAAGNGKSLGDSCAADGYINSVYTIAVASATQSGQPPYYGERCAAIITTAYSSGNRNEERITTTDIRGKCTTRHSGTSAAAPLAAGIIGLALQANPSLTWRCVQHLITWTSEVAVLGDDDNWHRNGAGFWVNTNFGFGLLNAHNMVKLARRFKQVPDKSICHLEHPTSDSKFDFTTSSRAHIFFQSNGCSGTDNEINYLEHVQVIISLSYPYRGAVGILLESPSGTKTVLMETRPRDNSSVGLTAWTLTSVHQWGEPADGRWTVKVGAKVVEGQVGEGGHFAEFKNGVSRLAQHRFGSHRDNDLDERHNHYERHAVTSDEDRSADHYRLSDLERRLIDLGTSLDDLHENANELRPSLDDLEPRRNFHQTSLDEVEGHVNDVEPSFGDLENPGYHNRPSFGDLENPGYHNQPSFGDLESHNRPTFGDLENPETHNRPTLGDLESPDHPNDLESRETHHRPSFKGLDDLMMNVDGHVTSVRILLHGTREMPDHYKDGRRGYSTYGHPREMDDTDEDDVNRKKERSKRRMV